MRQFACSSLFGRAALVLALLSKSRRLLAVGGYAPLTGAAGLGRYATGPGPERATREIHPWAAGDITLALFGLGPAIAFPGLVIASSLGYVTWTPLAAGIGLSVAMLCIGYRVVARSQAIRTRPP